VPILGQLESCVLLNHSRDARLLATTLLGPFLGSGAGCQGAVYPSWTYAYYGKPRDLYPLQGLEVKYDVVKVAGGKRVPLELTP
jgi:hypothetical protein